MDNLSSVGNWGFAWAALWAGMVSIPSLVIANAFCQEAAHN
jgi:hypothetical protein